LSHAELRAKGDHWDVFAIRFNMERPVLVEVFKMRRRTVLQCMAIMPLAIPLATRTLSGWERPPKSPEVDEEGDSIVVKSSSYTLRIRKSGFRFQFEHPDGDVIAGAHAKSGLQMERRSRPLSDAVSTVVQGNGGKTLDLLVTTGSGVRALVTLSPGVDFVRFSVRPESDDLYRIVVRTAKVAPAFGLGDHGAFDRSTTDLTDYVNEHMRAGSVGQQAARLISNFVIFPKQGFAEVNIEPRVKIVRFTNEENAQGSSGVREMNEFYYFVGSPQTIYRRFLQVRNSSGYKVYKPKYEFFGVGWEAWGAVGYGSNRHDDMANITKYLDLGYPLRWVHIGSGEVTKDASSFDIWQEETIFPDPRGFISELHKRGLKVISPIRIGFVAGTKHTDQGLTKGLFITENGKAKEFYLGFYNKPVFLLDAQNPQAVKWFVDLYKTSFSDYGTDGIKEDLFGYGSYDLRDDKMDPVNAVLMENGVYVMERNGYLGSPADIHRYDDFNYHQFQDRGPINGLSLAYSGFPYVYPDIVAGYDVAVEGNNPQVKAYIMRYAQYAALNPSMSFGYGPWNYSDDQVTQVTLEAARLHDRLQDYIYSAALDTYETGFPYTLTPLPLAYPGDASVYDLANSTRRSYEWMISESLLATPLYGDDYATANSRDVYLPAGKWIDYDTHKTYDGPTTLKAFALPVGKTPLFVGGKGIVIEREEGHLFAFVYPVLTKTNMTFNFRDGRKSTISVDVSSWEHGGARVTEMKNGTEIQIRRERSAIVFPIEPENDYRVHD
jgi:alpha-glucosidase (family GH31 glycosyl hydrolase)